MTLFDPDYGETPLPFDELDALLPHVREALDQPIMRAAIYDLEQYVQDEVSETLVDAVFEERLTLEELLSESFLSELHRDLYGEIWKWAGVFRQHELNIGVDPASIVTELRMSFETIRYRWENTRDWTAHQLGLVAHVECVRIHPFVDGNGRSSRLLADLIFAAAQDSEPTEFYDWAIDKDQYIQALRKYDVNRDIQELSELVWVHQF